MLPFHRGEWRRLVLFIVVGASFAVTSADYAQQTKKRPRKKGAEAAASATATPEPNSQVPLPIGHEAKGLVFPDIDETGHLRGRFVAGTARRLDRDHMQFRDLQITTFTDDGQQDLQVTMTDSVLDLNTRVLSSPEKTTIKRADFDIVGDTSQFDTAARKATVTGNVKMVLKEASKLIPPKQP